MKDDTDYNILRFHVLLETVICIYISAQHSKKTAQDWAQEERNIVTNGNPKTTPAPKHYIHLHGPGSNESNQMLYKTFQAFLGRFFHNKKVILILISLA